MSYSDIAMLDGFNDTPSVTITMQTHRNFDAYEKDRLTLKNLLKDAKEKLLENYSWREIEPLLKYLEEAEDHFDPTTNLDTVVFFISNVIFKEVKLPIEIRENNTSIGSHFETKKLLRAMQQTEHYYVLALSRDEVRLVECYNDKPVKEIKNHDFPARNHIFMTNTTERYTMGHKNNYIREFFKTVDSSLQKQLHVNPLPIVLAGVDRNVAFFKEIASRTDHFIGELFGGFVTDQGIDVAEVATKAFEVVQAHIDKEHAESLSTIKAAEAEHRLQQDLNAIYRSSVEGRIQTLSVEKDYYEPGEIENHSIRTGSDAKEGEHYVDDIVNSIVYYTLKYGGGVNFLPNDSLEKYGSIVARTKY